MAPEKRNEFLDASDSEDEIQNYDSDDDLKKGGRNAKRRKVDSDDEASDAEPAVDDAKDESEDAGEDGDLAADQSEEPGTSKPKSKEAFELPDITTNGTKRNLVVTEAAVKKSGVVYISRVPPFMKPAKLRSLLEPYGKINRIFLSPEDPTAHARRVRAGGNKKRTYTEGWVEFLKKKDAKAVCDLLNANIIGGKKGSYYHDDIWNLMYLKGFKWHNLTEQIATENAERASRMRAEISKSTKENKEFVRNIEQAKVLDGIQAKAKSKKRKPETEEEEAPKRGGRGNMSFKQIPLAKKGKEGETQPDNVTRVLSKIF
ncbi:Pre-rRNA-processing protein ESF2 [Emericellopsis atlantica]|uniref:18S rRNA factor 2 n=1 Tax=Emericellopsis atlantica TaxID=2614577 RepID=A0A9P7ZKE8_9HYPO|nr:Pre-rRNA-processing protein ESF2 [Emericellopsis atlantica]KAG9253220.1 Pre-rRNA-processing protein ESF2 [Emericellopsis atlantica]